MWHQWMPGLFQGKKIASRSYLKIELKKKKKIVWSNTAVGVSEQYH